MEEEYEVFKSQIIGAYGPSVSSTAFNPVIRVKVREDPEEKIPEPIPVYSCEWCGGTTMNDKNGHCAACGGPRLKTKPAYHDDEYDDRIYAKAPGAPAPLVSKDYVMREYLKIHDNDGVMRRIENERIEQMQLDIWREKSRMDAYNHEVDVRFTVWGVVITLLALGAYLFWVV